MNYINHDTNLISREESTSIKGLVILLIILGHIGRDFLFFQFWLYSYHLILFFMIPFLYGRKETHPVRIFNIFLRLYVPYLWVLIMCTIISFLTGYTTLHTPIEYIKALLNGSQTALKETVGFNFPWFMPAFFFLSLFIFIKDISTKWSKALVFLILLYGLFILFYMAATSPNTVYTLSCISRAAAYFFLGYITFHFIAWKQSQLNTARYKWIVGFIFVIGAIGQATLQKYYLSLSEYTYSYTLAYAITEIITPVAALCFLYGFKEKLSKQKFLRFTGNLSFEIYCFHVIILNCLWKVVDVLGISSTPITAGAIFLTTCILSIGVAFLLKHIPLLHKLLFPRGKKIERQDSTTVDVRI